MAKSTRSASDLAEELAGQFAEKVMQVKDTATAEVREYLGKELAGMARGTRKADDMIRACIGDPHFVITDDFRAGFAFAAQLVADQTFEY